MEFMEYEELNKKLTEAKEKNTTVANLIDHNFVDGIFFLFDKKGNEIYWENSRGYWAKYEYDLEGRIVYSESSKKEWAKYEYDSKGNEVYFENYLGHIEDKR